MSIIVHPDGNGATTTCPNAAALVSDASGALMRAPKPTAFLATLHMRSPHDAFQKHKQHPIWGIFCKTKFHARNVSAFSVDWLALGRVVQETLA